MSRFVVLRHDSPRGVHWDFLLQTGEVLATWALAQPPDSAETMLAEALPDHRLAYLDYEGPISGGRGSVTRWDQGTYRVERQSEIELVVTLQGEKLTGRATLVRLSDPPQHWRFSFHSQERPD
jgi:DNA ligase D-like protein (predicted 3'-phosphoesterase)